MRLTRFDRLRSNNSARQIDECPDPRGFFGGFTNGALKPVGCLRNPLHPQWPQYKFYIWMSSVPLKSAQAKGNSRPKTASTITFSSSSSSPSSWMASHNNRNCMLSSSFAVLSAWHESVTPDLWLRAYADERARACARGAFGVVKDFLLIF